MIAAYNHLLRAYVLAYNACMHDLYAGARLGERRAPPAQQLLFHDLYWSDKLLLDLLGARERGVSPATASATHIIDARGQARLRESLPRRSAAAACTKTSHTFIGSVAIQAGRQLVRLQTVQQFDAARFSLPLLDAIYASPRPRVLDYIGLDYYTTLSPRMLSGCRCSGIMSFAITIPAGILGAEHHHQQVVGLARAAARTAFLLPSLRGGLRALRAHRGKRHGPAPARPDNPRASARRDKLNPQRFPPPPRA